MKILSILILCSSFMFAQQGELKNLSTVALDVALHDADNVTALKIEEVQKVLTTLLTVSGLTVDEDAEAWLDVTVTVVNSIHNAPGAFAYNVSIELLEKTWLTRIERYELCTVWIGGSMGIAKKSEPHALIYATDKVLRKFVREWRSDNSSN